MRKKIIVIGGGFAGLSAACFLAKDGHEVHLFEKNEQVGGRARVFEVEGFRFDMGPSWYWMPDVFEKFFANFGKKVSDYYELIRLSPSYRVIYDEKNIWDIPASVEELARQFEEKEEGSAAHLHQFLKEAAYKYEVGINKLVYKPGQSVSEFIDWELISGVFKLDVFQSMAKHIHAHFKHPDLIKLLEFPVLFLGGTPQNTPALYSLMNYADISLGTWYPKKGMNEIVQAMLSLAKELGVNIYLNSPIEKINIEKNKAKSVIAKGITHTADIIIGGADYQHIEQEILEPPYRHYSPKYWDSRVLAPSSLIFYLGINKKLNNLLHHNLFFDEDLYLHAEEIYNTPKWPSKPLFYVSCPSKTDDTIAPEGCENVFLLMPVAPGIEDNEEMREKYFRVMIERMEKITQQEILPHIVYKRSYAHQDFIKDYHAFKGNAYGLANTLMQTAILKPSMKSKKVKNLYFTGQLTVPGPGVPPALISGQVVAQLIKDKH
ncbi:MAG: phytoene desaturase family protein [Bacteroidia bacterium]